MGIFIVIACVIYGVAAGCGRRGVHGGPPPGHAGAMPATTRSGRPEVRGRLCEG